jgi:hypothetical protein
MKRTTIALLVLALSASAGLAGKKEPAAKKQATTVAREDANPAGTYQYLPEPYGSQAAFTQAEYLALKMTAYSSRSQRIAAKLVSLALQVDTRTDSLVISAFVELTEKEKASYLGDGRFSYPAADLGPMMQEGVDFIDKLTGLYFADLDRKFLVINLYMKGVLIGSSAGGQLRVLATGK